MFKRNRGISLIEVCVGIAILATAITAIVEVFYINSLTAKLIKDKTQALGFMEQYLEEPLYRLRLGDDFSSGNFNWPPFHFYRSITNLSDGLKMLELTATWPKVRPTSATDVNQEVVRCLADTFKMEKETRTTGEQERLVRFQWGS